MRKRNRQSFRDEVVAMHRAIFRRNQERINRAVFGYTKAFQRYEREYARGLRGYQRRASVDELEQALAAAQIVYVGDYHTLPQAQRAVLRLLRRVPAQRPILLALEFVRGRHQATLDRFMAGRLSECEFLDGIEHASHWVFGGWESFRELFAFARERNLPVIGIDTTGAAPAASSLEARDKYAARRIAEAALAHPEHLLVVLIGELHIAPMHLPSDVDKELERRGLTRRSLILYQNSHEVYWQLEKRGLEDKVEIVRLGAGRYCLMNTPPIVCQQSFLNWVDMDEEAASIEAPRENFTTYARLIASFFDLPLGDALDDVQVHTVADLSFLSELRRRGDFSASDLRQIRRQIMQSESYCVPAANMVYLGNLSVNHAAEEATHFIRHIACPAPEPRGLVDAFYARCLEEALGFLGSKLINHKRKCARVPFFQAVVRNRHARKHERALARLVLKHVRMEQGRRVRGMDEVYSCSVDSFNAVTHVLGYRLGERMYSALVGGRIEKGQVRGLFLDAFDEEGEALATYLWLIAQTDSVELPERM